MNKLLLIVLTIAALLLVGCGGGEAPSADDLKACGFDLKDDAEDPPNPNCGDGGSTGTDMRGWCEGNAVNPADCVNSCRSMCAMQSAACDGEHGEQSANQWQRECRQSCGSAGRPAPDPALSKLVPEEKTPMQKAMENYERTGNMRALQDLSAAVACPLVASEDKVVFGGGGIRWH